MWRSGSSREQDTSGTQECGCETDHKEYLLLARRQLLNRVLKRRLGSGFALHNETPVLPKTCYALTSMRQSEVNELRALLKLIRLPCLEGQDYRIEVQLLIKTSDPVVGNGIK